MRNLVAVLLQSGREVYLAMAAVALGADKNNGNKTPNRSASCTLTSRGMFAGDKFNHQSDKHKGDSHINLVVQTWVMWDVIV